MASIKRRPDGVWRARYRDVAGKEHARHFPRKVDAQAWLDEVTASVVRGDYRSPSAMKMTFDQWAELWIAGYGTRRASTVKQARSHLRLLSSEFGRRPLSQIQPSDVLAWTARLKADGMADSYVYALHSRLSQLLGDAVHDGILVRNPCSRRTSPGQGSQRLYVASTADVWALHAAMPAGYRNAVLLGAYAGLRVAEAAALRVSDVDYEAGVVRPVIQYPHEPLKTEMSKTPIPVPLELTELLREDLAAYADPETVVVSEWERAPSPSRIQVHFRAARATVPTLPEGFRFHDLRHYFASLLIRAGLDIKTVQTRMRHESASTTLNVYGHMFPDTDESARAAIAGAIAARADSVRTSRASAA